MPAPAPKPQGFTMVELIVIIVVGGFLGVLLVNMLGTRLLKSAAPLASARDAVQAETAMESVVAYYTQVVNNSTTGALDAVTARYPNNATLSTTRNNNFDGTGVDALTVTVTENGLSLTTVLTQGRTNAADNATNY